MSYYKNANNELFWLENNEDASRWLPSCTAITDEEANLLRTQTEPTYAEKRAAEYPPIANYLDGVVKGDKAQIDKYIADCLAVKAKYPKPEASL